MLTRILLICLAVITTSNSNAMGNHPQSSICPTDKPFYSFCSHSLHSLEGWYGECRETREQAQLDADNHAKQQHDGRDRWTGVLKNKGTY